MNVLVFGSDSLQTRVRSQCVGQSWDVFSVSDPDELLDFEGTHSFQAMVVGLCVGTRAIRAATKTAKQALDIPVVIGLASREQAEEFCKNARHGPDIVITDSGNDDLTKLQCDAVLRLANGAPTEDITCGGVTFHTSRDVFSVNNRDIHLPLKNHRLLELLFLKRGRTVTNEMVFNHLYGWEDPPHAKIIDVFVCQIRKALRKAGLAEECIHTVWGQGYTVVPSEPGSNVRAA